MSDPQGLRASGQTQVDEVVHAESMLADAEIEVDGLPHLPEEGHQAQFRTPGFSRMRTDWTGPDGALVRRMLHEIDEHIVHEFADAYVVMNDLFEIVRTPELDATGMPMRDAVGLIIWKRKPNGSWDEDWNRLTRAQKENFLFAITTRLFAWEQRAAERWTESMVAKGVWEEAFSVAYTGPQTAGRPTIEDRTATAKAASAEDRYFAIFSAAYSRRADAIVRCMRDLGQRLKDTLI